MNDSDFNLNSLPWAEIIELSKSERFGDKFKSISEETLRFAMEDGNSPILVQSALNSLKKTDPKNANVEHAEKVADMMKIFAWRIIGERENN